ncbi:hypothetical protein [Segetibacter sp. 3557_3]|nr:hypothetical protein [Segetibacter sp. 3557_3]
MTFTLNLLTADYPIRPTYLFTLGLAIIFGIIAFMMYWKKRRNRDDKVG